MTALFCTSLRFLITAGTIREVHMSRAARNDNSAKEGRYIRSSRCCLSQTARRIKSQREDRSDPPYEPKAGQKKNADSFLRPVSKKTVSKTSVQYNQVRKRK